MKHKIRSKADLLERIRTLEIAKIDNDQALHASFQQLTNRLRPSQLLQSTIDDLTATPKLSGDLVAYLIATLTGLLSKKIWVGQSKNPMTQWVGTVIELLVSNFALKHADTLKMWSEKAMHWVLQFLNREKEDVASE